MRAIRSRGNASTERKLRALLIRSGIRGWKIQVAGLVGNPDFYFPAQRLVVFVDGCFWHSCPNCGHIPHTNKNYWTQKLVKNRRRDLNNSRKLRESGFKVLRLWECQLRKFPQRQINKIISIVCCK